MYLDLNLYQLLSSFYPGYYIKAKKQNYIHEVVCTVESIPDLKCHLEKSG